MFFLFFSGNVSKLYAVVNVPLSSCCFVRSEIAANASVRYDWVERKWDELISCSNSAHWLQQPNASKQTDDVRHRRQQISWEVCLPLIAISHRPAGGYCFWVWQVWVFPWFGDSVRLSVRPSHKLVQFTLSTDHNVPIPGRICPAPHQLVKLKKD